jgi:O-methyltransferase
MKLSTLFRLGGAGRKRETALAPEMTDFDRTTVALARPYTMTSTERLQALILATRYVARRRLPGAFVECGVWRGGSMFAAARTLLELEGAHRELFLYDTYSGMPPPDKMDVRHTDGQAAAVLMEDPRDDRTRAFATLQTVKDTMVLSGYDTAKMQFVVGKVEDTIPNVAPEQIALLRLDTDWYSSTLHELEHLYSRLVRGGVLIIDDYGWWEGARKAVDEFFSAHPEPPLLNVIDQLGGRMAVKA